MSKQEIRKIKLITIGFLAVIVAIIGTIRAIDDINRIKAEQRRKNNLVSKQFEYIFN